MYEATPEPTEADILRMVPAQTIQQRQLNLPDATPGCKFSTYRMLYGVERVCALARKHLQDDSIVIRIRTDSVFEFDPDYLKTIFALPLNSVYVARPGDGFDWFALTTFRTFLKTWTFPNLISYNQHVESSWNPEDVVKRRVPVPIHYLDRNKVTMYIVRENNRKHFYN
jgi:hypothetical protein